MPRTARAIRGGWCYHVMNRGNNRATVFASQNDYLEFLGLMVEAQSRHALDLLAVCLMPNHFHLVARPAGDLGLSEWVHWLLTTHVRRHHGRRQSSGRVWQGRFKAFPIEQDGHLLTVIRYVERNALRAGIVARAEKWPWGSLAWRCGRYPGLALADSPVELPSGWIEYVNAPQTSEELDAVRRCATREQPFGSDGWAVDATQALGLTAIRAGRGRPRRSRPTP
jgi:putative transposase